MVPAYVPPTEGQWYWCVNCGHHGDYGYHRKRNVKCEECGYEDINLYTLEEINDPDLDNVWLERFKKKGDVETTEHKELMKTVKEAKQLLSETKTESKDTSKKIDKQSVLDKIAEIRVIK